MTLLARSTQPWDEAFDRYAGAHLIFHVDASKVTTEQLLTTASLPGVTAAGPPYETVTVAFARGDEHPGHELPIQASAGRRHQGPDQPRKRRLQGRRRGHKPWRSRSGKPDQRDSRCLGPSCRYRHVRRPD